MRQAGILAAAARVALRDHCGRLSRDHENARAIARTLGQVPGAQVDLASVQTNIVMVDTPRIAAERVVQEAARVGVLVAQFGPRRIRIVTHLDVDESAVRGAERLAEVIAGLAADAGGDR